LKESTNPNLADVRYVQLGKHQETGEDLPFILRNTIELDQMFRDMLLREPIFSLAEAIVGTGCKFCGQNVLRNKPGLSIDSWHVDGEVHFPLPNSIERYDPRIQMRVMWFTVQMALSDIELIEHGPTQYVPVSHYSGRNPNNQVTTPFPYFVKPVIFICKIQCAGIVEHPITQTAHDISYNRSMQHHGHIGALASATKSR
jgi:hypothetical protein